MEKLIYALVPVRSSGDLEPLLLTMKGIAGADLYMISSGEIAAVAGDACRAGMVADKAMALAYAEVIETLSQQVTLLPMRLGSWMETSGAVINMLERNHAEIQQNLLSVENRYEFGLRVFCEPEKLLAELKEKSETQADTRPLPVTEVKKSASMDWVNKKLKEHRLEELLVAYVDSVIADIRSELDRLKAVCRIKKMVTPATIIDGVFLLDKRLKDEVIQTAGDLQKRYPGLNIILTGPWAPYNFVDFKVK